MKTIRETLPLATEFLEKKRVLRPRLSAEHLLSSLLNLRRMDLYMHFDRPLSEKELAGFRDRVARRARGEPLDYIIGRGEFLECPLKISNHALIPRPETELLAEMICSMPLEGSALDLCTGSGCLAIALKTHHPDLNVFASDLSDEALTLARENAVLNEVEIDFRKGDLFEPFEGDKFDLIVCNPPYISAEEYEALDPEVKNFEPKMALLGGEKGDEFYQKIARDVKRFLQPGAKVFFEIGHEQGSVITALFSSIAKVELKQDLSGKDRFVFLEFQ